MFWLDICEQLGPFMTRKWIAVAICHIMRWFLIKSALIMLSKPNFADLVILNNLIDSNLFSAIFE